MPRYIGIDPGSTLIGFGVVDEVRGALTPIIWGVIEQPGRDSSRDKASVAAELASILKKYRPASAGVERLFFMNNQRTAMAVAEMRGVIMLTLQQCGLPVLEFTPQQVKQNVCGHGRATKRQIQDMVRMLLRIQEPIRPDDAADGLALALCCVTATKTY